MGSANSIPKKYKSTKKVVVIGGGIAGVSVARLLEDNFDVTLIERRDAFIYKIAGVRACVKESFVPAAVLSNKSALKTGKLVTASVEKIDSEKQQVLVDNGPAIPYDYLVIASGATNRCPVEPPVGSKTSLEEHYTSFAAKVKEAKKIVIVGGGPVGVELAAEIKVLRPSVEVHIVHSAMDLCDKMKFKSQDSKNLVEAVKSLDVKLHLGFKAGMTSTSDLKDGVFVMTNVADGKEESVAEVSLIVDATGTKVNTEFVPSQWLNEKTRQVRVNGEMQVLAGESVVKNVYAAGDCTDVDEPKLHISAGAFNKLVTSMLPPGHAVNVAYNIYAQDASQKLSKYAPKAGGKGIISLGPNFAFTVGFPNFVGKMKCGDFFVANTAKVLRVKAPKAA